MVLHFLVKRLRIVYIPGLSGKMPRNSDIDDVGNLLAINTRQSKVPTDEGKFNELIANVNFILYYLSSVEVERASQETESNCDIKEPIQVTWAAQYGLWMFQDDLDLRIYEEKKNRLVNDSIATNQNDSQSYYFRQSAISGQINDSYYVN